MSNKVKLSDAVFYDVDEIVIENDPDKGHVVYINLICNNGDKKLPRTIPALGMTRLTLFAPGDDDEGPPRVYVDGQLIEPNPQPVEEELEETDIV